MTKSVFILGPCAAETEEQVMATAKAIKRLTVDDAQCTVDDIIFRAGIWKPRTSPNTFQGIGTEGLYWLQRVQAEIGLDCATEVVNTEQLQAVADAHIPYIWIGARTSANPIAVQEISDALCALTERNKHVFKGVFIKNPVNEDVALWIGNIERLEQCGLPIAAIHRGCNHHPCWKMAYELHQQRPDIPILLDPSHMSGDRNRVPELCAKGAELGYNGYMVEVHIQPKEAWSDAQQQIEPNAIRRLTMHDAQCTMHATELLWQRAMMDEIDDALWSILKQRMDISQQIGVWKKAHGVDIVQPERYQDILQRRLTWAAAHNIRPEAVRQIMDAIHTESVRIQS